MARPLNRVAGDAGLPAEVDVVVIGGGIAGIATALPLLRAGLRVAVCEKGEIAGEQSSRAFGLCRQFLHGPAEMPLVAESQRIWHDMTAQIGSDSTFRACGIHYAAETPEALAALEADAAILDQYGIPHVTRTGETFTNKAPGLTPPMAGAVFLPTDGCAEPAQAVPAMALGAHAQGLHILTRCAVRGLERSAGRISAVVTERGRIACQTVVLAGGVWTKPFLRNLGLDLPVLDVEISIQRTRPLVDSVWAVVLAPGFSYRPRVDGGYNIGHLPTVAPFVPDSLRLARQFAPIAARQLGGFRLRFGMDFIRAALAPRRWRNDEVSPFERTRMLDPVPDARGLDRARDRLAAAVPWLGQAGIADRWAGTVDITADQLPVIGPVDAIPGLFLCSGLSGHGFGTGPGAGALAADLILGNSPRIDPTPFRYERFRG